MSERLRIAKVERDAALAELHHVADHLGTVRHELVAALARIATLEAALHHSLSAAKLADVLGRILERNAGGKPHFSGYNELCRALAEYRASAALADAPVGPDE